MTMYVSIAFLFNKISYRMKIVKGNESLSRAFEDVVMKITQIQAHVVRFAPSGLNFQAMLL